MDKLEMVLLGVGVAVFAYPLSLRALASWVHPYRIELAQLGDELLGSPFVSDEDKDNIERVLDDAFNWRVLMLMAVFAVVYVPSFIWNKSNRSWPKIKDEGTRAKFDRFMSLTVRSLAAANPIAALICALELAVLTLLLAPLGKLSWQMPLLLKAQRKSESVLGHGPC